MRNVLFALLLVLVSAGAAAYQDDHIDVTFIAESSSLQPGQTHWLGVLFAPKEHWHVYWQNPGDSGRAPTVSLTLPEGLTAGELRWPAPEAIAVAHLVNYGYHRALLMIPVRVADSVHVDQSLSITAKVSWLVCQEECVPGRAELQLTLPVASRAAEAGLDAEAFAEARHQLAQPLAAEASYRLVGDRLELAFDVAATAGGDQLVLYPITKDLVAYHESPVIVRSGNRITASFLVSEYATDLAQPFEFVAMLGEGVIYQGRATAKTRN